MHNLDNIVILAPILGGLMNDQVGYRQTNDIMLLVAVLFTVAYVVFFGVSHKEKKKIQIST